MRQFEEFIQQTELVHQFESGRMNRVAPKIAQKIRMFLENEDVDAGTAEQIT